MSNDRPETLYDSSWWNTCGLSPLVLISEPEGSPEWITHHQWGGQERWVWPVDIWVQVLFNWIRNKIWRPNHLGLKSQTCFSLAVWTQVSYLMNLSFFVCPVRLIPLTTQAPWEECGKISVNGASLRICVSGSSEWKIMESQRGFGIRVACSLYLSLQLICCSHKS